MRNYYIQRILSAILTLFLIASLTFFMMHAIPGGPFSRERSLPPQIQQHLEEKYNLDDPLIKQYFDYMVGLITFDVGLSFKKPGYSVSELITLGLPYSMEVGFYAILLIILLGVPLGIISALKQNKPVDYFVMFIATLGVTVPSFVVANLFLYFLAYKGGYISVLWPTEPGINPTFLQFLGPVVALSGYSLSFVSRLTRSSMLEVMRQDYIRTARANGIPRSKVIFKHALKNALIPAITYLGPMIAGILTGSFVVEKVFSIPGIGQYFTQSVTDRDYTVIVGTTAFYAALYIVMILLVDVAYSLIDPRIRLGKRSE
ncbi:MAG TPA: ABC transporter permease [Candidatus Izemoplasmatales bacterium]|nr:ABC transporter permease [Bacillota bacterium]HRY77684.1 ABC transporter permease [Candidatus Izemoplasmatales bacterium]